MAVRLPMTRIERAPGAPVPLPASPLPRGLVIVARDRGDVYDIMRRSARARSSRANLEIRFDRRIGDRRRTSAALPEPERRQGGPNRRVSDVTSELRRLGWVLVWPQAGASAG